MAGAGGNGRSRGRFLGKTKPEQGVMGRGFVWVGNGRFGLAAWRVETPTTAG